MSSRNCEACSGTGEKPSMGHMLPYKCQKCSGTGIIHNFNDIVGASTIADKINDPLAVMAAGEEQRLQENTVGEPKKRGRPAKI